MATTTTTTQSSSSYEDDEEEQVEKKTHNSEQESDDGEEEQVEKKTHDSELESDDDEEEQVEKKTHDSELESDDDEEEQVEKKTHDSEQESDDDEEEQEEAEQCVVADKKTNQEEEGSTRVNHSKKRLVKNVEDESKLNDKKQKKNEAVVVALSSVDDKHKPKPKPKPNTTTASTSNGKVKPFERMWSAGDELVLLQGMINYKQTHNGDLIDTKLAYKILLQSIIKSLSFDYSISQLQNKIRSLKRKYDKVVLKTMSGVENLFENNSHEEQSFNLSKVYWDGVKIIHHQSSKKKLKVSSENCEFPNYCYLEQMSKVNNGSIPITLTPGLVAITAQNGWEEAIGKDNAACMNQKSKDLIIAEGEVFLQRCELIIDQTKLMLDALKK